MRTIAPRGRSAGDTTPNPAPQVFAALPQRLLTLPEVAEYLGISLKTLQRRIAAGDLVVVRDGRLVRVTPQDLARYIATRRTI